MLKLITWGLLHYCQFQKKIGFFILHFFWEGSLKRFQDDQMAEWDIHCNSWSHHLEASQGQASRKVKGDCQSRVKEKTILVLLNAHFGIRYDHVWEASNSGAKEKAEDYL